MNLTILCAGILCEEVTWSEKRNLSPGHPRQEVWNLERVKGGWEHDVCEDTPMLANARLYQKIGDKAKDKRYEPRVLPSKKN